MRLALRLSRPAPNQNLKNPRLWQDPVYGYYETHGKMEFFAWKNQYNCLMMKKKSCVVALSILKKEYFRREYNPHTFKYKQGIILDPAMFRWYAADMTQMEYMRLTPRSLFMYAGITMLAFWLITKLGVISMEKDSDDCLTGEMLWWDRYRNRFEFVGGNAPPRQVLHAHC
uniref:NADH dehydrogenase [ubiquinone] 1 beta subcomplex subunit 4 n=1 Tax=Meloidogyne enterolobii TaxID=390850 RepID=A0A6V7YAD8_MELEN|nr:unnamed protein product [Meloidogyne enterolobii]